MTQRRYFDRHHPQTLRSLAAQQDHSEDVMICLRPSDRIRKTYAGLPEATQTEEKMHLTLWYGGLIGDLGGEPALERLFRACYGMAIDPQTKPLDGEVNGFGWFINPGEKSLVALWDIPYITNLRMALLGSLELHGVAMREENHGFTPHMTIANVPECSYEIPRVPEGDNSDLFDSIWLVWGLDWHEIVIQG